MKTQDKVNVYTKTNKSGSISYVVDLGGTNRKRLSFKTEQEANKVAYDYNVQRESKQYTAMGDLGVLMGIRYELLDNYRKLQEVGATFTQAVDFFLKKSKRAKGDLSIKDTYKMMLEVMKSKGLSDRYTNVIKGTYYPPFAKYFGEDHHMTQITGEEINKYISSHSDKWSNNTKRNHITNLSVAFNFLVKKGYLAESPIQDVDKPIKINSDIHFLKPHQVLKFLKAGLKEKMYGEVAIHILVLFCGIRMEEALKMTWADINNDWVINVGSKVAKLRHQRKNKMPDNARKWWMCCRPASMEERKTLILSGDVKHKLSDLRKLVANFEYPKNSARHSFATYHIMFGGNPAETCLMMGHTGDYNTLYNHYRNAVTKEEAIKYFNLVPTPEEMKEHKKVIDSK